MPDIKVFHQKLLQKIYSYFKAEVILTGASKVGEELVELNDSLTEENSQVKNDIYKIIAFMVDDVEAFATQLLGSVKTELGQCQVRLSLVFTIFLGFSRLF